MKKILIVCLTILMFGCSSMVQKGAVQLAYSNFEDRTNFKDRRIP